MFSKAAVILLLMSTHYMIEIASAGLLSGKIKSGSKDAKSKDGKPEEKKVSKAPKLTPEQIEFSKKFFKNLNDDQEKGMKGIPLNYSKSMKVEKGTKLPDNRIDDELLEDDMSQKAAAPPSPVEDDNKDNVQHAPQSQPAPGGIGTYKSVPSGGTILLDSIMSNCVPIGDPFSGLPDK